MQVQDQQGEGGAASSNLPIETIRVVRDGTGTPQLGVHGPSGPKEARPRRTLVMFALGFVLIFSTAVGVTIAPRSDAPSRAPALDRRADDGLRQPELVQPPTAHSGTIDVTGDYGLRHPGFPELQSIGGSTRVERAVSWLEGLATRTILPTDVTGRLHQQDPRLARAVVKAWQVLSSL